MSGDGPDEGRRGFLRHIARQARDVGVAALPIPGPEVTADPHARQAAPPPPTPEELERELLADPSAERIAERPADRLGPRERERYARALARPTWDEADQLALRSRRAVVVGAGALGGPIATALVAAGVGRVGVVDEAVVELDDLPRQTLHLTPDVGTPKAAALAAKLTFGNDEVAVDALRARLDVLNADAMVAEQSLVVDATGDEVAGGAMNDACVRARVPLLTVCSEGTGGSFLLTVPGEGPCRRCAELQHLDALPGDTSDLVGAAAAVVASTAALAAVRLLTEPEFAPVGMLVRVEPDAGTVERTPVRPIDGCPVCGGLRTAGTSRGGRGSAPG